MKPAPGQKIVFNLELADLTVQLVDFGIMTDLFPLAEFDVAQNTQPVSIADEAIEANATTNAFSFTVNTFETGYSIQGKSGKYIGYNAAETQYGNDNGLQSSATALLNQLVLDNLNTKVHGADGSRIDV